MVDYRHKVSKICRRHAQSLYGEPKDLRIEYRFWQPFHFDFYHHLVHLCYINKREALVIQMKYIDTYELGKMSELAIKQLIIDLKRMGLELLMEFRKPWNNEVICQFYASYHLDTRESTQVIHWTTKGKHYKVDFPTFAHLLGLDRKDHCSTAISEILALAMDEYQYMCLDGHHANGHTIWLKPYYYVLNNILHQILYPKSSDSTHLRDDS
jgi:hypothetical protein